MADRDARQHDHPEPERDRRIREDNAKMVALNQRDAQTKWGQLEVFMTRWRRIEALTAERGPFHLAGVADRDDINPARRATNAPNASSKDGSIRDV
jgi:hypothetical protein